MREDEVFQIPFQAVYQCLWLSYLRYHQLGEDCSSLCNTVPRDGKPLSDEPSICKLMALLWIPALPEVPGAFPLRSYNRLYFLYSWMKSIIIFKSNNSTGAKQRIITGKPERVSGY